MVIDLFRVFEIRAKLNLRAGSKWFFFEKTNQKTLICWACGRKNHGMRKVYFSPQPATS
jgi:hypothetical protein